MRFWRKDPFGRQPPVGTDDIRIHIGQSASETIVDVSGRVTVNSSPCLRSALLGLLSKTANEVVVINLALVALLDTSGMATLLEALVLAQQRSVKLRLVGVNGQVRKLAEMMELGTIFSAAGSEVVFS